MPYIALELAASLEMVCATLVQVVANTQVGTLTLTRPCQQSSQTQKSMHRDGACTHTGGFCTEQSKCQTAFPWPCCIASLTSRGIRHQGNKQAKTEQSTFDRQGKSGRAGQGQPSRVGQGWATLAGQGRAGQKQANSAKFGQDVQSLTSLRAGKLCCSNHTSQLSQSQPPALKTV